MDSAVANDTGTKRVEAVIANILQGMTLRNAIQAHFESVKGFFNALSGERELGQRYARAMEVRADLLVDDTIQLADSNDDPAKVRNQINVRQWIAAKHNSKRYGDRIDLNVNQSISVDVALNEARSRLLRPVSDQLTHDPSQVIDLPSITHANQSDATSEQPSPRVRGDARDDPVPDIFS